MNKNVFKEFVLHKNTVLHGHGSMHTRYHNISFHKLKKLLFLNIIQSDQILKDSPRKKLYINSSQMNWLA